MPIYNDVPTIDYYPNPEQVKRKLFEGIEFTSVLDVGAGHGGVFDLDYWQTTDSVKKKEACDIFWIRDMPEDWQVKTGVDVCKLTDFYAPNSFDMVQCCEVLEHVPDNRTALEQLIAVARKAVFITSADEMHHVGPEQAAIEKINEHQAYIAQPKIADLQELGFTVRVTSDSKRQIVAWYIKE